MNTGYRRQQTQQSSSTDPGWILLCVALTVAVCLASLPWITLGFVAQYTLARWLHWRVSFLLWFILLFVCGFSLYNNYQHGLEQMIGRELVDYLIAAKLHQSHLAAYPLCSLWSVTWLVWLHTWQSIGIAGFVAELYAITHRDTARTLRQQERSRIGRIARAHQRARKRAQQHLPDRAGGMMMIGVPINDDERE